jgi:hypothetical protein
MTDFLAKLHEAFPSPRKGCETDRELGSFYSIGVIR